MRRLTKNKIERLAFDLSNEEINRLFFDWYLWARDDQLPPNLQANLQANLQPNLQTNLLANKGLTKPEKSKKINWNNWILMGGRGSGKTRAGAEWVRAMALGIEPFCKTPAKRIALIGETFNDVREVMLEGESGLLNIHPQYQKPTYIASRKRLEWPNGSIAQLFSAEEPESLRGPQFHIAWCDEFAKWQYASEVWDMLQFGLRLGDRPQIVITTTPRNKKSLTDILALDGSYISKASTFANKQNLATAFLKNIDKHYAGTNLGRQELFGDIIEQQHGALWQPDMVEHMRMAPKDIDYTGFKRVILAIDPPVTSHKNSDACGMIVAATDGEKAYILEDATMESVSPLNWAKKRLRFITNIMLTALLLK